LGGVGLGVWVCVRVLNIAEQDLDKISTDRESVWKTNPIEAVKKQKQKTKHKKTKQSKAKRKETKQTKTEQTKTNQSNQVNKRKNITRNWEIASS
jgi:hypothetical protein